MIYQNLTQLVGNTPVVLFEGLYLKLEYYNPTGSVKDRPMYFMIKDLEDRASSKRRNPWSKQPAERGYCHGLLGQCNGPQSRPCDARIDEQNESVSWKHTAQKFFSFRFR